MIQKIILVSIMLATTSFSFAAKNGIEIAYMVSKLAQVDILGVDRIQFENDLKAMVTKTPEYTRESMSLFMPEINIECQVHTYEGADPDVSRCSLRVANYFLGNTKHVEFIDSKEKEFRVVIEKDDNPRDDINTFLQFWNIDPKSNYEFLSSDKRLLMTYDPEIPEFVMHFKNKKFKD